MIVEAIYRDGRLELIEPLKLNTNGVRVLVTVPDSALASSGRLASDEASSASRDQVPAKVRAATDAMLAEIGQIHAGTVAAPVAAAESDEREDRLAAMALRAQARQAQGRPN